MQLYKLRAIAKGGDVAGITIPLEVAKFFSGCYFKIEITNIKGRYGIFCESGCIVIPNEKDLEKYDFGDCRL